MQANFLFLFFVIILFSNIELENNPPQDQVSAFLSRFLFIYQIFQSSSFFKDRYRCINFIIYIHIFINFFFFIIWFNKNLAKILVLYNWKFQVKEKMLQIQVLLLFVN